VEKEREQFEKQLSDRQAQEQASKMQAASQRNLSWAGAQVDNLSNAQGRINSQIQALVLQTSTLPDNDERKVQAGKDIVALRAQMGPLEKQRQAWAAKESELARAMGYDVDATVPPPAEDTDTGSNADTSITTDGAPPPVVTPYAQAFEGDNALDPAGMYKKDAQQKAAAHYAKVMGVSASSKSAQDAGALYEKQNDGRFKPPAATPDQAGQRATDKSVFDSVSGVDRSELDAALAKVASDPGLADAVAQGAKGLPLIGPAVAKALSDEPNPALKKAVANLAAVGVKSPAELDGWLVAYAKKNPNKRFYTGDPKKAPMGARRKNNAGVVVVKTASGWTEE